MCARVTYFTYLFSFFTGSHGNKHKELGALQRFYFALRVNFGEMCKSWNDTRLLLVKTNKLVLII